MTVSIRIGTQGWNYADWLGGFYPDETRAADFLSMYARAFDTVEVDSTFYAVPTESALRSWVARTPPGFVFSLKLPRSVTHEERLRDESGTTELFFDRVRVLGDKLGPVLVQLGPDFGPEELPALVAFLPRLPRDVRVAVEFRHRGWMTEGVLAFLAEHEVAVALVDGPWIPRRWALRLAERPTAGFAYVRWMGPDRAITDHSHIQIDRSRELGQWAEALRTCAERVGAIYAYTSNYFAGHAPQSAREIQRLLGQRPVDPGTLGEQIRLF